jgi:hypothetical protein
VSSYFMSNGMKKIKRTIILPAVLCACKSWFLTLKDRASLMVFGNRMLRKILASEEEEKEVVIQ